MPLDLTKLKGTNFTRAEVSQPKRIIMSVTGNYGEGKTHLAVNTAPGPLGYFNFDIGDEGVIDKAIAGGKIIHKCVYPTPYDLNGDVAEIEKHAQDIWVQHVRDFKAAIDAKFRTLVVDTATEQNDLLRLARFGKLSQNNSYAYGPVNAEYRRLLRSCLDTNDVNLILIHRVKKLYKGKDWSGQYCRAGFSDLGFIVQVEIEVHFDKETHEFSSTVVRCRQKPELIGTEFSGEFNNFPFIAAQVMDGSPSDFEN